MSEPEGPLSFDRRYWDGGFYPFAGIDEAGRGALFGPVVAAAVVLDRDRKLAAFRDSKTLRACKREELYGEILKGGHDFAVGLAEAEEIDRTDILSATLEAMKRAFEGLSPEPALAVVDGNQRPRLKCKVETLVGGDGLSLSVAAASIVAKVTRDRLMDQLDDKYPGYCLRVNKGYGTREHIRAVLEKGPTPLHRKSFRPISGMSGGLWR